MNSDEMPDDQSMTREEEEKEMQSEASLFWKERKEYEAQIRALHEQNSELRRSLESQQVESNKMAKYAIGKDEQVRKLIESLSALTSILNND